MEATLPTPSDQETTQEIAPGKKTCCGAETLATCCAPSAKTACCGSSATDTAAPASCGCQEEDA